MPTSTKATGQPIVLVHGFASNKEINWVGPGWVTTLTRAGPRVIALDDRGHGASQALRSGRLSQRHHGRGCAGVARPSLACRAPTSWAIPWARALRLSWRCRTLIVCARPCSAALGIRLVGGRRVHPTPSPMHSEAPSLADVSDPTAYMFRAFAEQTKSDLRALAACLRGSRQALDQSTTQARASAAPVLVAAGAEVSDRRFAAGTRRPHPWRGGPRHPRPRPHAGGRRPGCLRPAVLDIPRRVGQ